MGYDLYQVCQNVQLDWAKAFMKTESLNEEVIFTNLEIQNKTSHRQAPSFKREADALQSSTLPM